MAQTWNCTVCGDALTVDEGVYAATEMSITVAKQHQTPVKVHWVCVACMFVNDAIVVASNGLDNS